MFGFRSGCRKVKSTGFGPGSYRFLKVGSKSEIFGFDGLYEKGSTKSSTKKFFANVVCFVLTTDGSTLSVPTYKVIFDAIKRRFYRKGLVKAFL